MLAPHDLDLERELLGAALLHPAVRVELAELTPPRRLLFAACIEPPAQVQTFPGAPAARFLVGHD